MPMPFRLVLPLVTLAAAGCTTPATRAVDALPMNAMPETVALATAKDTLDSLDSARAPVAAAMEPGLPRITGRGFAQVARQPGRTVNERRLMAMRAARMEALRDLAEQVHGVRISSDSLLRDVVLRSDRIATEVQGTLRGARTVSILPKGEDGYEVLMELDPDTLAYLLRAVRGQA